MNKVISIVVFGEGDRYAQYLPAFVRAHLNLFPLDEAWELRVHIDDTTIKSKWGIFLHALSDEGLIKVVLMGTVAAATRAMLWRLRPVFSNDVSYSFSRDLDACPMPRDRAGV